MMSGIVVLPALFWLNMNQTSSFFHLCCVQQSAQVRTQPTLDFAVQAVFLDLDGTMVNTVGDFAVAVNVMLTELRLPPVSTEFIAHTVGKGSVYLITQTLLHVGQGKVSNVDGDVDAVVDQALFDTAHTAYLQHYERINAQNSHIYAGVQQGLAQWHAAGVPLACITNKPVAHAQTLLQTYGIAQFFACVHGGDSFERRKPDPLPLLETAKLLGCQPQHVLMIGDSVNDAQAAASAGCPVVLVRYGYNHGKPIETVPAQGYIDSLADLRVKT